MLEAVDLGAENDERMARLREALALGGGFQLVIVQVEPGEQREEVLRRLAGWSGRNGVPQLELVRLAAGESPVTRLASGHAGVILVGLEAEGPDRAERTRQMVTELNWSRDRLPELVRGPLVLVVSQRVQTELFEQAPDFYSWRTHSTGIVARARDALQPLRWLDVSPEDPADLETMITGVLSLSPPPLRELGKLYARLALAWTARGDDTRAESAFRGADDAYTHAGTLEDRVALLILRSEMAAMRAHYDGAEAWLKEAQQTPGKSRQQLARLARTEALLALDRGDLEAAAAAFPAAISAARDVGDLHGEAVLLVSKAWLASRSARVAEEIAYLEQAVERFHTAGFLAAEAAVLSVLARAIRVAGRNDDAEELGRLAVTRAEESGGADAIATARAQLGLIACQNGHLELAEEVLRSDVSGAGSYTNAQLAEARAQLALRRGDDATAERWLREALAVYERGEARAALARVSLELAGLGQRSHRWTLAEVGMDIADRLGDASQRAESALRRAMLAMDRAEPAGKVAELFAVATQRAVAAEKPAVADIAREGRALALMEIGRGPEARTELETALAGFDARGQAEEAKRIRDLLAEMDDPPAETP